MDTMENLGLYVTVYITMTWSTERSTENKHYVQYISSHDTFARTIVMLLALVTVGLLVMVSSELVILLIVCVGINTGSALQGELAAELTPKCTQAFKDTM